jgi:hypothetical protein
VSFHWTIFFLWAVSVKEEFSPCLQLSPVSHRLFAPVNEGFSYQGPPYGALDLVNQGPTVSRGARVACQLIPGGSVQCSIWVYFLLSVIASMCCCQPLQNATAEGTLKRSFFYVKLTCGSAVNHVTALLMDSSAAPYHEELVLCMKILCCPSCASRYFIQLHSRSLAMKTTESTLLAGCGPHAFSNQRAWEFASGCLETGN